MSADLSQASDQDLAAYARAGRDDAYRELLSRYKAPVYRLIVKHIGDPDEALDLTQETFLAGFSGTVVSGREGLVKPDPAIYRLLLERYALNAERTVFIDDKIENVDAARALGFHGIHFTDPALLRPALRALGLPV